MAAIPPLPRRRETGIMSASVRLWPAPLRWAALLAASALLTVLLDALKLPAARLLGPMVAAIALAGSGQAVKFARPVFFAAQGLVGVMIAANLPITLMGEVAADWPVFVLGTCSTLCAAGLLGWVQARSGLLPGTTAIWGSAPGAATAMTLMSESYGADMRMVAFMQYLRVVSCAVVVTVVVRVAGTPAPPLPPAVSGAAQLPALLGTLALAWGAAYVGLRLKVPGGPLLCPMVLGLVARLGAGVPLVLPGWLLALAYAVVGWGIGLRFTREVLGYAARVFPRVLGAILALIALCAGFGGLLVKFAGIDPLTAYLATSPGGADSVAIIAVGTRVDIPFVMAMQVARFLLVLVLGPALARRLSGGARQG